MGILVWPRLAWAIAIGIILPIVFLIVQSLGSQAELFEHLWATVLTDYILNTIQLVGLVLLFVSCFALPAAWLIAMCQFPGRRYFEWLLMLPLAMPAYVVAYVYTDLLDFAGPIQTTLRDVFQQNTALAQQTFFDIRTIPGAALMLALVLYPYLYLVARTAFSEHGAHLFQISRSLGKTPWQSVRKVAIPLSRPAIVVGLLFVGAETLGDFATVNYFAVNTLTTAVYDSWLGHGSLTAAAKISLLMLVGVVGILTLERWQRGKQRFYHKYSHQSQLFVLTGWRAKASTLFCLSLIIFGFFLPVAVLLIYVLDYWTNDLLAELMQVLLQTVWLSLAAAVIATIFAVLLAFTTRLSPSKMYQLPLKLSSLGYMLPSTVLAVAVLMPMTSIEHITNDAFLTLNLTPPGLFLSGTVFALVFAFVVRFQAVANGAIETSFLNISPSLDMASNSLGKTQRQTLQRIHLPLIKKGLLTALLLVFIECMKELPAALLLRPFNFDTLATFVYQYVSDEQLEQAAFAAILIVLAGLYPVMRLTRGIDSHEH